MSKFIEELKDNFQQRITNPFIISFLTAWFFINWDLLFILFTFDQKATQSQKLEIVNKYLHLAGQWGIIWFPLLMAFSGIISFYLLYNVSRLIARVSNEWITPFVDWLVKGSSVATRESLNKAHKSIKILHDRVEELEDEIRETKEERNTWKTDHENLNSQNQRLNYDIDQKKLEIKNLLQKNEAQNEELSQINFEREDLKFFDNYFSGNWVSEFQNKAESWSEYFRFLNRYVFLNEDQDPTYKIESITYNKKDEIVKFVLVGLVNFKARFFKFNIKNLDLCEGTENNYSKVKLYRSKVKLNSTFKIPPLKSLTGEENNGRILINNLDGLNNSSEVELDLDLEKDKNLKIIEDLEHKKKLIEILKLKTGEKIELVRKEIVDIDKKTYVDNMETRSEELLLHVRKLNEELELLNHEMVVWEQQSRDIVHEIGTAKRNIN